MDARCSTPPENALVLQPHLKELEQSSKAFLLKNTENQRMGCAGISGLAKTYMINAQTEEKATVRKIY